jgi:glycosyltransferase involved in cell wall biosynthesis
MMNCWPSSPGIPGREAAFDYLQAGQAKGGRVQIAMDVKDLIVIYTFSPFPFGEATSNRIFALARCMQAAGYQVVVLSNGAERAEDYESDSGRYLYRGVEYRNYGEQQDGKIGRILRRNRAGAILNRHLCPGERERVSCVYVTYRNYGLWQHLTLRRSLGLPVVVDVTEWHSSHQFTGGRLNPAYWLHDLRIRYLVPRAGNVICITTFLDRYFRQRGCNTVIIPPQVSAADFSPHKDTPLPPMRLFYAGTAARKDYLDLMLDGLASLSPVELQRVRCTLVGTGLDSFKAQFPKARYYLDTLGDSLEIVDRVPKTEIDRMLSEVHFLILMRPLSRYSNAGFPSKVPEALAAGVPVITNLTSDLEHYLKDMHNSIIVEDFGPLAFAAAVRKALRLSQAEYGRMSQQAVQTALRRFDYSVHRAAMGDFLRRTQAVAR